MYIIGNYVEHDDHCNSAQTYLIEKERFIGNIKELLTGYLPCSNSVREVPFPIRELKVATV